MLVLHAGYYAGQSLSDTWEWDGITWRQISVKDPEGDGNPIGIKYHGMAYDVVRQHTVLFGGVTENGPSAQTWQYNGTSWELQSPTDPEGDGNPSARSLHSMAFDTKRGVTVLLGGYDGSNRLEDTWEWNGTSWTHIVPLDPEGDGNPAAREGGQMAFDRVRGVSVMGGGTLADYSSAQDLWEWDGSSWKQPAISDPEADGNPTLQPCMAFDTENGLTLSIRQGVVWGWDGISWEKVATYSADGVNGPQGSPFAAYFEKDELLVTLYTSHYIRPLKTWIHDGDSWQDTGPQHYASFPTPGARQYAGSAFDPGRGRMVLMGGYTGTFSEIDYASDTWEWNGHYWEEIEVTDSEGDGGPTAIYQHAMAFADHINGGEVLLFGGTTNNNFTNQSWIYDGTRWMQLNILDVVTGDGNPMARFHHNIAYDSDNHHMVLFGGREAWGSSSGLQDTWELGSYFSANEWDLMNPQDPQGDGNPAKRFAFGIAYDDALNKTVMYGGQYYMDRWSDTWEWDGASWDLVDPDDPEGDGNPGVRVNHNLVYDAYRQRTVLGFGTGDSTLWNDTWEWLGSSWRQLLLSDPEEDGNPLPRVGACMEHDTIRNNLVLIGGGSGAGSGTWIGRWGHEERPGHHAAITFWAAGNCAPPDIQELSVNYWSGASSYVNNTPVPGAQLLVWDQGFWNIMDTNAAPAETPQLLEWSTDTSEILNRILVGDLQELHLAVTPLQYNMKYLSTISTGYLEVQVSYRLPADAESTCD